MRLWVLMRQTFFIAWPSCDWDIWWYMQVIPSSCDPNDYMQPLLFICILICLLVKRDYDTTGIMDVFIIIHGNQTTTRLTCFHYARDTINSITEEITACKLFKFIHVRTRACHAICFHASLAALIYTYDSIEFKNYVCWLEAYHASHYMSFVLSFIYLKEL